MITEKQLLFIRKYLQGLYSWHQRVTEKLWNDVPEHWLTHITSVILIYLAISASAHMRIWQYDQWSHAQDTYYVNDFPSFSTTDAAYFLLTAKEIKTYGNSKNLSTKRSYPDYLDVVPTAFTSFRDEPLLALMISYFSPDESLKSLSMTAHRILPISIALTSLAVILAFGAARFWSEGAIAALGSSLSGAFLERTSAGRLDTDQLNLGFFYLITALIIWAGRVKNFCLSLALCGVAAAMTHLFHWWWPKPILNWIFLVELVWLSYCFNKSFARTAVLGTVYLALISNLNFSLSVNVDDYTVLINSVGQMKLPNTFSAITELEVLSAAQMVDVLTGNIWLAGLAILGLIGSTFVTPVLAVVFLPAIVLGMMNILFGNRMAFFAAPICWFGIAWLALNAGRYVLGLLMGVSGQKPSTGFACAHACLASIMLGITYLVSFNPLSKPLVPDTAFSREVIEGFELLGDYLELDNRERNAVIATWWDYGYTASLFSQLPVLIDGGTQRGPKTHLMARALTSGNQGESARILKYISNDGTAGIIQNSASNASLAKAFLQGPTKDRSDVYLVLTSKMTHWMPSITSLGLWNSETGTPLPIHLGANQLEYIDLACTGDGTLISCSGKHINLQDGTVDGRAVLSGAIQTDDGMPTAKVDYPNPNGFYLQFNRLDGAAWANQLLHPTLYNSTFNKLFYHGDFDPDHFTPFINAYPHYRVYKIN